ncbi:hypothetical protein EXIGLDRAFT_394438 [Exidia glandulosa HHB12029]|uniref:Uncharacterized protein n=1 Tax=Exidia glandulosa HHB12029 TaxID=1314781 RepID=A0A165BQD8_EXIGL|nr:hypothetical protein EXIGLDRAFT_394438 [Exidia glandulosa HHB12029]
MQTTDGSRLRPPPVPCHVGHPFGAPNAASIRARARILLADPGPRPPLAPDYIRWLHVSMLPCSPLLTCSTRRALAESGDSYRGGGGSCFLCSTVLLVLFGLARAQSPAVWLDYLPTAPSTRPLTVIMKLHDAR